MESILKGLLGHSLIACSHVGSEYILGSGADTDYLARVKDLAESQSSLASQGFVHDGTYIGQDSMFCSMRKDRLNIILTTSLEFFSLFQMASDVCKYLRVENKAKRIAIHEFIRDGVPLFEEDFLSGL